MAESTTVVSMALAMDSNKLIGKDGALPWHIPSDLKHFKAVTLGKPVIMGRITYDSIGRPLPGRMNIVVTRNADWQAEGVTVCASLDEAIEVASVGQPEVVVIGGAALCRAAMDRTQRVYLTYIDFEYEGDTWFDSFNWDDWFETDREDNMQDDLNYAYLVLERKPT